MNNGLVRYMRKIEAKKKLYAAGACAKCGAPRKRKIDKYCPKCEKSMLRKAKAQARKERLF